MMVGLFPKSGYMNMTKRITILIQTGLVFQQVHPDADLRLVAGRRSGNWPAICKLENDDCRATASRSTGQCVRLGASAAIPLLVSCRSYRQHTYWRFRSHLWQRFCMFTSENTGKQHFAAHYAIRT